MRRCKHCGHDTLRAVKLHGGILIDGRFVKAPVLVIVRCNHCKRRTIPPETQAVIDEQLGVQPMIEA